MPIQSDPHCAAQADRSCGWLYRGNTEIAEGAEIAEKARQLRFARRSHGNVIQVCGAARRLCLLAAKRPRCGVFFVTG
jgi:hypothetical protein